MNCSCNGTGNHVALEASPDCQSPRAGHPMEEAQYDDDAAPEPMEAHPAAVHIAKCAFCLSSNVTIVTYANIIPGHESRSFKMKCATCGSGGPRMTTLGEAVHSWGMMTKVAIEAEDRGVF